MRTRRVRAALAPAAALAVGLVLGAGLARRAEPGTALVRPLLGLVSSAPREALEPASVPPPSDSSGPATAPWRLGGEACRWLEAATGVPYADPRGDGWRRIDTCMRPEWRSGGVRVVRGAWAHDPALDGPGAGEVLEVQTYGGSVVEGYVDAELGRIDSWPRRLEARLAVPARPGPALRVRSYAMAGASSGPQLWRFRNEGLAERPALAILYTGENDLAECRLFDPATDRQLERWYRGADFESLALHPWLRRHRAQLEEGRRRVLRRRAAAAREEDGDLDEALTRPAAVDRIRGRVAERRALAVAEEIERARAAGRAPGRTVDPAAVETSFLGEAPEELVRGAPLLENVADFVVTARAHGIVPVVVIPPYDWRDHPVLDTGCATHGFTLEDRLAWFTRALPGAMRAVAERHGAEVVDLPAHLEAPSPRRSFFIDAVHLSEQGMDGVVELLVPVVLRHLEGERPAG